MDYYAYGGVCLARPQNEPLPPGALRVSEPFDPTVFLFYDLSPQSTEKYCHFVPVIVRINIEHVP